DLSRGIRRVAAWASGDFFQLAEPIALDLDAAYPSAAVLGNIGLLCYTSRISLELAREKTVGGFAR
ncbi:MAG: hypothetical protein ACPL7J_14325, partial [Desulfomonilaceae bacterium]